MTDANVTDKRRVLAADIPNHRGERVCLEGWLHAIRKFGAVNFLILRDRTGMAQAVLEAEDVAPLDGLQVESVLCVEGIVEEEPRAANGVEIRQAHVTVLAPVTDVLPFELNKKVLKPTLDVFLNNASVGLRYPSRQATFRLYSDLLFGFREYLMQRDFVEIHTPKIVGAATEGGANVFQVDYFGRPAFLAQSPQLYKQIMVGVLERVFEVGPAFRAEEHYTVRHLNEYNSLDVELGFIDGYEEILDLLTELLEHMVRTALQRHPRDAETVGMKMPRFGTVPRIKFRDAQRMILERHGEDRTNDLDLSPQDERWIGDWASEEFDSDFAYVTHYPTMKRAFYTLPDPDDPEHSLSFDLLFQGQELVSGSQRVNRYDQLLEIMRVRGMNPDSFSGYLQAFKYGMPPEGGFAIGSERLLMRLVGAENLRETTLFPRDVHRLTP